MIAFLLMPQDTGPGGVPCFCNKRLLDTVFHFHLAKVCMHDVVVLLLCQVTKSVVAASDTCRGPLPAVKKTFSLRHALLKSPVIQPGSCTSTAYLALICEIDLHPVKERRTGEHSWPKRYLNIFQTH